MADKDVPGLTGAAAFDGTETFHVVQGGNSRRATSQQQADLANVMHGALVKKLADQTAANYTAATAIAWNAEAFDTDTWHDTVANNSRLTVPSGVSYVELAGNIRVQNGTDELVTLAVTKNGAVFDGQAKLSHKSGGASFNLSVHTGPIAVVATDYFELTFQTAADTSIDIIAAQSSFSIRRVG